MFVLLVDYIFLTTFYGLYFSSSSNIFCCLGLAGSDWKVGWANRLFNLENFTHCKIIISKIAIIHFSIYKSVAALIREIHIHSDKWYLLHTIQVTTPYWEVGWSGGGGGGGGEVGF